MDPHRSVRLPSPGQVSGVLGRVGRYELCASLASGHTAELFLARHGELAGLRTVVLLKRVRPELAADARFVAAFLEGARVTVKLDHPNVVRVYEVGRTVDELFVAMELVQGKPLASLLRRAGERGETLSHRQAALVIAQAAAGLHHAHGLADVDGRPLGFVHRDLSPQKILISFEGAVKVIDFDGGGALGRVPETNVGRATGRTGYLSPEQAHGAEIDHRTDIFALGVILWEAVCGRPLFAGKSDLETTKAIIEAPIPRPSTVTKVAGPLEAIIMRALSREPAERFGSAFEMAGDLERYVSQSGGGPSDLAPLMKVHFAEEQVAWRSLVHAALTLETGLSQIGARVQMSHTGLHPVLQAAAPGQRSPERGPFWPMLLAFLAMAMITFGLATLLIRPPRRRPAPAPAPRPRPATVIPLPAGDRRAAPPEPMAPEPRPGYPGGDRPSRKRPSSPPSRPDIGDRRPNPF
jgi:serine/threonine-protein kinase